MKTEQTYVVKLSAGYFKCFVNHAFRAATTQLRWCAKAFDDYNVAMYVAEKCGGQVLRTF